MRKWFGKSTKTGKSKPASKASGADDSLYQALKDHTFASPAKLHHLKSLAATLNKSGIAGDFVECGTYKGGSSAVLGTELAPGRSLWLYDSFAGMPDTNPIDGDDAGKYVGEGIASPQDVLAAMQIAKVDASRCVIRKGWFENSFKEPLPESVALLHCDADWYDSCLLVLETFYPLVVDGGCVVLDDFGYWEGCREAFYTFCERHGERPLLERHGNDQAYWFKGRKHNRS